MSKKIDEFRMPAEWEPQKSVWMSWPHNKNDWPGLFEKIPNVVGKIIKYLTKHQRIDLLVNNTKSIEITRIYLKKIGCNISNIKFHKLKTDRLWLRDSGPIFLINKKNREKTKITIATAIIVLIINAFLSFTAVVMSFASSDTTMYPISLS